MVATVSNKVRYYTSAMPNAPTLSGTAGALIAVLDACLVDGFDTRTINSITVTDGIAVGHISAGHAFGEGDVIRAAGVTNMTALNDDWRLASVTADTVTWSVEGLGIADGSATGTMTCKRAPAGWEKVFADGTTRAAYRSLKHAEHNGLFLYVNDTGAHQVQVRGFESLSSLDAGTGPFPTDAQLSGGVWWGKSFTADGVSRAWTVVADDRRFVFVPRMSNLGAKCFGFGLLLDAAGRDLWGTMVMGAATAGAATATNTGGAALGDPVLSNNSTAIGGYLARALSGAQSIAAHFCCAAQATTSTGNTPFSIGQLPADLPALSHVMVSEPGYLGRGFFPGPCFSNRRFLTSDYAPGSRVGMPGHGVQLEYASAYSLSLGWFVHLGAGGRWD